MNINVNNISPTEAVIEIEGTIGVEESWQFDTTQTQDEQQRVATYEKFRNQLAVIKREGVKHLRINIRSSGGAVEDALLIHSALSEASDLKIETHCYGFVASAATIIAQAASPDSRYVASTALYMIHNASIQIEGNAQQAMATVNLLEKTDEQIAGVYALRSGRTSDHFRQIMAREGGRGEWLTPSEAIELGLADVVEEVSTVKGAMARIKNFFKRMIDSEHPDGVQDRAQSAKNEQISIARSTASASETIAKEDPEIQSSVVNLSGNQRAYLQDAELFRN